MSQGEAPKSEVSSITRELQESVEEQTAALFKEGGAWQQLSTAERVIYTVINKYKHLRTDQVSDGMHNEFVNGLASIMLVLEKDTSAAALSLEDKLGLFMMCLDGKSQQARLNPSVSETKIQALARHASDARAWVENTTEQIEAEDFDSMSAALMQYETALPDFVRYLELVRQQPKRGQEM